MAETTPSALNDKLNDVINLFMRVTGQKKTPAVKAIAGPLKVRPRQIYHWLSGGSFPPNADNLVLTLDEMAADLSKGKPLAEDRWKPAAPAASLPFQITISKDTLKITQDASGNITVRGFLSLSLI